MRRLALMATVMMLVIGGAVPAYAEHGDAIDGVWQARDPYDGSLLKVTITEHLGNTGYFTVELVDSRATFGCSPAARVTAITTNALYDDGSKVIFADFTDIRCKGKSEIVAVDGIHAEFKVLEDNETMVDVFDPSVVYRHIRG
ncbi:MAG TPA: hypothetical protein VF148_12000 [Acidimicrobiia bacterium]